MPTNPKTKASIELKEIESQINLESNIKDTVDLTESQEMENKEKNLEKEREKYEK